MLIGMYLFFSDFPLLFYRKKYFKWDWVVLSKPRVSIIKVEQ